MPIQSITNTILEAMEVMASLDFSDFGFEILYLLWIVNERG